MKIECPFGNQISDVTDGLPFKGRIILDQDWDMVWTEIDKAIEASGSTQPEKEEACMRLRGILKTNHAYQCTECGRLLIEDSKRIFHSFIPEQDQTSRHLFAKPLRHKKTR